MASRLRISCALAIVAAVTLMLELVLIRAFDAMMNAEMSHLIITCAMFSFGLSGVYASLRPLAPSVDRELYLAKLALAFGVFTLLLLPSFNLNPFNYSMLGSGTATQVFYLAIMYVTLMVPFLLSGMIFTTVFTSYAAEIRALYCFDLCGAAVGSVMFIPLIPSIGPGGLLFLATGMSFAAAVLFLGRLGRRELGLLAAALVVVLIPFGRSHGYFDFAVHEDKRRVRSAELHDMVETTRWDPVAKIEVMRARPTDSRNYDRDPSTGEHLAFYKHVAYDGGEQSSRFYHFDGDYPRLRRELERNPGHFVNNFWNRSVVAAHWFHADQHSDVLIIGSAGGQETKAALLYEPRSVDTVEMVKVVVDLATNDYAHYIGGIFSDPRVHPHVGEGRTYLRRSDKKFDIIQIFSNYLSSSAAAGGGVGRGFYLQTVEAYQEYFSHLSGDGILQINHHVYPRMIATAAAAWKAMGRSDFRSHVMVYSRPRDPLPLVLIKMSPWTRDEVHRLDTLMLERGGGFELVEDPRHPRRSFLSDDFYSGHLPRALVARVPYRVTPTTDDKPYFNFLRKHLGRLEVDPENFVNASIADALNTGLADKGHAGQLLSIPMDIAHYVLSGAVGLLFALLFVLVPLFVTRSKRERGPGELTSLAYFSLLGAGFIIVELTLVPIFMKLIGVPLYTYSTIIFTMLAAAGLGSSAAKSLKVAPDARWWLPCAGTVACGVVLLFAAPLVADRFLSAPMLGRILAAALFIGPVAFFMGMCLPLGVFTIRNKPPAVIAWAWGMNGLFTTVGGLGATLLAMFWGLRVTLLIALGLYGLAGLVFMRLRGLVTSGLELETAPERDEPPTEETAGLAL